MNIADYCVVPWGKPPEYAVLPPGWGEPLGTFCCRAEAEEAANLLSRGGPLLNTPETQEGRD